MASETTFDHRKVVFSWGKVRKMPFSQNPLMARFWSLGILFINHFCARKSKNLPWVIFFLLMHVQDPCDFELFWVEPGKKTPCIDLYVLWTGIFLTCLHFCGLSFSINRNHCTWVCKVNIYPGGLEPARLNRSFDFVIYLKKTLTAFTALENSELRDDRKLRKSFAKMNFV